MTTKTQANQPVAEIRDGLMKIAIFRNEGKQEGDRPRFTGKLTRAYRDAAGDWHETDYMSSTEFLRGANLLIEAYNTERKLRQAEQGGQQLSGGPA
jgi:hypothetical protein